MGNLPLSLRIWSSWELRGRLIGRAQFWSLTRPVEGCRCTWTMKPEPSASEATWVIDTLATVLVLLMWYCYYYRCTRGFSMYPGWSALAVPSQDVSLQWQTSRMFQLWITYKKGNVIVIKIKRCFVISTVVLLHKIRMVAYGSGLHEYCHPNKKKKASGINDAAEW